MTEAYEIAMEVVRSGALPMRLAQHSLWANYKACQRGNCAQTKRHAREMIYWISKHHPLNVVRETAEGMLRIIDRSRH